MSAKPAQQLPFDASVLSQLACPACQGDLRSDSQSDAPRLTCAACRRAYPIADGIPVLIVERAETPQHRD